MDCKAMLAYVTGSVDEKLLLRIGYLVAKNRILRDQIKGHLQLSEAERQTLAPWPIWATTSAIRRWVISSSVAVSRPLPTVRKPRPGRHSPAVAWTCYRRRTSSVWK